MKIALVMDTILDSNAGIQQYVKNLARYLLAKGHQVKFIVPKSKPDPEFAHLALEFGTRINPLFNTTSVPISIYLGSKKLKAILNQEKFDLVHITSPFSPFLGAKVLRYAQAPAVSTYGILSNNWLHKVLGRVLTIFVFRAYRKILAFTAPTVAAKNEARFVMPGKYEIIPFGINQELYQGKIEPVAALDSKETKIFYLGRLEKRKGVKYLMSAFALIKQKLPQTRLLIAGKGPEQENLAQLAKELNVYDSIDFLGFVAEEQKANYYASADICVFPATYGECFGFVLVEALASGKIPVAFDNPGYRSTLEDIPELLVKSGDIEALADKIVTILSDQSLKSELEKECRLLAEKYDVEKMGAETVKLYNKLLQAAK